MNKHTPGPWERTPGDSVIDIAADGKHIAIVGSSPYWKRFTATDEADARLIAAAPDMLAALRNVQRLIAEAAETGFNWKDGDWAERLFASQHMTSSAIRKATGQHR